MTKIKSFRAAATAITTILALQGCGIETEQPKIDEAAQNAFDQAYGYRKYGMEDRIDEIYVDVKNADGQTVNGLLVVSHGRELSALKAAQFCIFYKLNNDDVNASRYKCGGDPFPKQPMFVPR